MGKLFRKITSWKVWCLINAFWYLHTYITCARILAHVWDHVWQFCDNCRTLTSQQIVCKTLRFHQRTSVFVHSSSVVKKVKLAIPSQILHSSFLDENSQFTYLQYWLFVWKSSYISLWSLPPSRLLYFR